MEEIDFEQLKSKNRVTIRIKQFNYGFKNKRAGHVIGTVNIDGLKQ